MYFLPVYVSAKLLGERACICFAILCGAALIALALVSRPDDSAMLDPVFWNAALQATELIISGYLISRFTGRLERLPDTE